MNQHNQKNPWWEDPSPPKEDNDNDNDNGDNDGDAYSVDESLYIDDDLSHTNAIPQKEDEYEYEDEGGVVTVHHHLALKREKKITAPPPSVPPPQSFGRPESPSVSSPARKSINRNSPLRKSSSSLSAKLSKGTAKLSKSLSHQWNSMRASPPRNKSKSATDATDATMEQGDDILESVARIDAAVAAAAAAASSAVDKKEASPSRKSSLADSALGRSLSQLGRTLTSGGTAANRTPTERTTSNTTDVTRPTVATARSTSGESNGSTSHLSGSNGSGTHFRRYTVKELIHSLGRIDGVELPPALERRVRDFKFAQGKRRDRHGDQKPWGIFGLYAHLSDIRADLEWAEDAAWRRQRSEPYLSWSDFEKSRDKGLRNRPWFTYGVIAVCSIMLLVTLGVNGWKVEPLNVNPLIGPSSETLIKCGARQTNLIVNEGQWFRLFTPMVLHAGLVHYVINMLAMYFIGGAVEQSHGFASAAVLFVLPAVGGNILSAICLPQYISVGASGGIFGLIGACMADISINWNLLFLKSTTDDESRWRHFMVLFWLAFDIILNCIIGFTPFVDNFTHLGGFLYGLCCGLSTMDRLAVGFFGLKADNYSKACQTFVKFSGLIVSVISIMVTTVVLVQSDGVSSPCHGCRYISCVPFPPRADEKWWYCDDCDFVVADLFVDGAGSGLYQEIELECPNGDIETIDIAQEGWYEREAIRRALPTYCRNHCDDVFATSN
jgi:membrane associated rhomboid family serine protease